MGLTVERLTVLGQQAHAIMIISIFHFCCSASVIEADFSLRGTRGISLEFGRLHSLKWKKRANKERKKKDLNVTLSSYAKSFSISLQPVGFNNFTRHHNVSQTHFLLAEKPGVGRTKKI